MNSIKYVTKKEALEIFQEAFIYHKHDPDYIWQSLLQYRRLLGDNEIF